MAALIRRHFTSRSANFPWSSNGFRVHCQTCSLGSPHNNLNRRDFRVYQPSGKQLVRITDFLANHIVQSSAVHTNLYHLNHLAYRHFNSSFAHRRLYSHDSTRTESNDDKHSSVSENRLEEEIQYDPELKGRGQENLNVELKIFYFFPHVRLIRMMCRMKLYQTGFTALVCPIMAAGYCFDVVPLDSLQATAGIAALALVMLYSTTYLTRRLVGMMFLSEDRQVVRISHLTFFGKCRDVDVPIDDVMPMSQLRGGSQLVRLEVYVDSEKDQTESRQDTDKTLEYFFCSIKYGRITDEESYRYVFGSAA